MQNDFHEYRLLIRESHLDTFGHVNNAVYLSIFEEARWDMLTRGGFGLTEIREKGIGPVVLEATIRFRKEVTNRAAVTIRSRTLDYRGRIGRYEQVMILPDSTEACRAEFVIALFDLKSRKLIKPTPEWLKAIGCAIMPA
jgi:acyl-CoA thioester hydrolase